MVGRFVLDTNIVLDWLVFRDPSVAGLQQALTERRMELVTHQPALDELRRVLGYPQCKLEPTERQEIFERYRSVTVTGATPEGFNLENLLLPSEFPRCRDRDDQHFLALAYHVRADGLVTKDKAILSLRKRARKFGVKILSPAQMNSAMCGAIEPKDYEPCVRRKSSEI